MSVVETSYGRVRGANQYGVHVFKGIPFAKPPVGDLRWRAPVPPAPWAGTREALGFGPCAVQSTIPGDVGELIGIATHEVSEDCLYLNVWTPKPDDARRPVMVWIHGGGNTLGAGSQPRVNGEHLARVGDVVVVTLNYRLGALGFLYAPELGATGNEALLDQVAALRWVRAEIGAFGGDPDNVTVFGQSAGGFDIAQLMAMPAAQGCFDRAVPMSGSLKRQATADSAYATAQSLAGHFGGFERLRAVPTTDILGYQMRMTSTGWGPTCDGEVIAEDAAKVLARGTGEGMPLMIGHTRDESTLFTVFNKELANMDGAQLAQLARGPFGTHAADAVACYVRDRTAAGLRTEPIDIWAAIATDRMFRIPAIRTAECRLRAHAAEGGRSEDATDPGASTAKAPVWMYRFDHESPAREGRLQACHSLDIPFVWGTYALPRMQRFCGTGEAVERLSRRVMASYLAFARSGNPANEEVPDWPEYDMDARRTMLFAETPEVVAAPMDAVRQLWSSAATV